MYLSCSFFEEIRVRGGIIMTVGRQNRQNLLNAGRNCVFFMCKPPQDLAHGNKKSYLFGGGKGVFLCFYAQKNACGHTLILNQVSSTT